MSAPLFPRRSAAAAPLAAAGAAAAAVRELALIANRTTPILVHAELGF